MAMGASNRTDDGALPSGREIARHYDRHERWGRLVKRSGSTGEFGIGSEASLRMVESPQVRVPGHQPACLSGDSHIHSRSSPGEGRRFLPSSKDGIQRGRGLGVHRAAGGPEEDGSRPERDGRKEGDER